jgi:hypothetical protein
MITATREKSPTRGNTEPEKKKTLRAQSSENNERWYTVRLFGTNSLKVGAM